jgi:DNA repair protein RadD
MELRDYQQDAVERIRAAYRRRAKSVLYVAPTGSGKTHIFSYIGMGAARKGKSVLVVVHRDELLGQAVRAFKEMGLNCGLVKPGEPQTTESLQVASAWTLVKRLERWPHFDLVVFDESHHLAPGNTFSKVFDHFRAALKLLVTATPSRLDGKGLKSYVEQMVMGPSMRWLSKRGYLAPCVVYAPPMQVDLSCVHVRMGDYVQNELAAAVDRSAITGSAVAHYAKYLAGQPAVCFGVTLAHCARVAEQFCRAGWKAAVIDGSMGSEERQHLIDGLITKTLNVLVSCQLLTEGVDVPPARGVILLRPTKSLTLFLQMCGRAMRPKPDGGRCFILDHVGNSLQLGMPDADRTWSLEDRVSGASGAALTKVCPECDACVALGYVLCPECGHEFERTRNTEESDDELEQLNDTGWREQRRRQELARLATRWLPSKHGNQRIRYRGKAVVVLPSKYEGWRYGVLDRSVPPIWDSAPDETTAKRAALNALLDAVENDTRRIPR